jgi:hypothetical protein
VVDGLQLRQVKPMEAAVRDYLNSLPSPQKEICRKVRKIILEVLPGTREEFRLGVPWYDGRFYLVGLKDHVNVGFCIGGLSRNELKAFEGRGKLMRHIKIRTLKEIDEEKLVMLVKLVHRKTGKS